MEPSHRSHSSQLAQILGKSVEIRDKGGRAGEWARPSAQGMHSLKQEDKSNQVAANSRGKVGNSHLRPAGH